MARGGRSNRKEGASLDNARVRFRQAGLSGSKCNEAAAPLSESFQRRRNIERQCTRLRSAQALERDIDRILADRRHTDFYIIHDCWVLETNGCIVKTRSPKLYESLESRSVRDNDITKCYIESLDIFKRIQDFSRLLYSNSSVKRQESILVRLVSLQEAKDKASSIGRKKEEEEEGKDVDEDELRPGSGSEMADSGLETGSLSPLENSESSVTDFEVSHADRVSMDDVDFISVGLNGDVEDGSRVWKKTDLSSSSSSSPPPASLDLAPPRTNLTTKSYLDDDTREAGIMVSVVDEKRKEPDSNAYRSRDNCFVLSKESFEFIDTKRKNDTGAENQCSPPRCSNDLGNSGGNTSSYYFIDASSLNDNELLEEPSREPFVSEEASGRDGESKISDSRVAPTTAPPEKPVIEKETLVVEIKEADSGESGQPSPCFEDTKRAENPPATVATIFEETDSRRGSLLIRRNTFELDPNDEKLSVLRQEYERRQGHLVFQNAIPQYSGHRVDGDSCFEPSNHSDIAPNLLVSSSSTSTPPIILAATKYSVDTLPQTNSLVESINKATNVGSYEQEQQRVANNAQNRDPTNYERRPSGCWLFAGDSDQAISKEVATSEIRGSISRGSPEGTTPSSRSSERERGLGGIGSGPENACPISESSSDKLFLESCSESDDGSRNCCNSLPITLNDQRQIARERRSSVNCRTQRERTKRDETTPILSGGVSTADYVRPTESPATKRRIESTPIVSGGSVLADNEISLDDSTAVAKPPARMASSMTAAWVVDMSDCTKNSSSLAATSVSTASSKLASNGQPIMSKSFSSSSDCVAMANRKNVKRTRACETKHASLGFFVNLNDIESRELREKTGQERTKKGGGTLESGGGKHSCEFFVDMSRKEENGTGGGARGSGSSTNGEESGAGSRNSGESTNGKKNIFSMFIDFREPKRGNGGGGGGGDDDDDDDAVIVSSGRPEEKPRDSKCLSKLTSGDLSGGESSSSSQIDRAERIKPTSVFMFIESDSPVVRRRALSSSRPAAFQRHSWNVAEKPSSIIPTTNLKKDCPVRREHKRAHSVSVDRTDLRTLHTKASNSSHSLSQVARADVLNGSNGNLPKRNHDHESSGRNTDTSTEEVFEYDTRDTPPNSHVEIVGKEKEGLVLGDIVGNSNGLFNKEDDEVKVVGIEEKGAPKLQQRKQELDSEIGDSSVKPYEDECVSEVSVWEKTGTESTTEGNTRKSETFDISSGASGASPESDNNNHYHLEDIRGEIANYDGTSGLLDENVDVDSGGSGLRTGVGRVSETHKSLTETIKKIESELKKPEFEVDDKRQEANTASASSFVRLSDLDATPLRSSRTSDVPSRERENETVYRMSNSIPETSWVESKLAFNRNNNNSSVRVLPRKFTTIMSTSLPAKHKSPIEDATECEADAAIISESDLSSMQSSMGRSGADVSTEETETWSMGVTKPYNRLGEDLLRMFLEEINPDVTIDVGGRKIRAHKCILSSRCQYFAAILSGGWIESTGNVITLQGYSYNAVHFALCHIYSGESDIPETLSIVELATLADMLCLEGLKEVIGYTLKVKYCHLFHKPCQVCAVGVLECMPLAAAYGLDEVYRKSLRWITRHFVRIWPCKAFAALPRELMDKCYHQHIVHMSADNVLQTMMDCDKLLATLPNVRWAEPVFRMVSNLLETAVKYISDNFSSILGNDNFQALGRDLTWNISRLEENFLAAADRLSPDQACKSYAKINKMLSSVQQQQQQQQQTVKQHSSSCPPSAWAPLFIDFLRKIQTRVEKCLVKEASRAARTTTWLKMDLELRRRIQELACLVILPHEALKRPSRHSNFLKEPRIPPTRTPADRSLDLRRVKVAISEQQKDAGGPAAGTKRGVSASTASAPGTAGGQQVKKSLPVKPRSDPLERKNPHEVKQQQISGTAVTAVALDSSIAARPRSWPNKLEVKSRYLEPPRNKSVPKDTPQQSHHERVTVQQRRKIIISSSDSSRTSSPAMKRAIDKKPLAKMKLTIKKDVRALSSDSLTEATSASGRLTNKKDPATASKSCGITRPESPSFKQNDPDMGLSTDSLAEPRKKKPQHPLHSTTATGVGKKKQQPMKLTDTWMSTDSLMAEIGPTPKSSSNQSNKVTPTTGKIAVSATTTTAKTTQVHDSRVKKFSPPMQQKNASMASSTTTTTTSRGRLPRSLECSTAASRNRAAATISAYHGSPNLRRNLLDAAKTPDIPAKGSNGVVTTHNSRSTSCNATTTANHGSSTTGKKEKSLSNQPSTESPSKKSSPKSNGSTRRSVRATSLVSVPPSTKRQQLKGNEEKTSKLKCHNGDAAAATKQPTVGSRSGTFLKDEPTILKKSDIKATAVAPATAQQITTT